MANPKPVVKSRVCSLCGLDWERHTKIADAVSAETCVELLKKDLAMRQLGQHMQTQQSIGNLRQQAL